VQELKNFKTCLDCGLCFPHYILDYDHRPGESKKANVNVLVKRGASKEIILAEIAKCDLICANCHRSRTFLRRLARKKEEESLL